MLPFQLTRPLQIAFLVLLIVSSAQVAWWIVDQFRYTSEVRAERLRAYAADEQAAQAMLREGSRWGEVKRLFPHLEIAPESAVVRVAPDALKDLDHVRFHRLNRYAWEGAFFLLVLAGAMLVVYRTLEEEAVLRRRQQAFLAAVSHELRSPLASLRLSAETLALRDPPAERRAELVQRLVDDLGRLDRMIANLLDASRLSAASARSAPEPVDVAGAVGAALEELARHAEECDVTLRAEVPAGLVVRADPEGMRTVLRNLLQNAIKAACGGGTVVIGAAATHGRVRLEVRDDGMGFPPAEAARLFQKFYRVEDPSRERPAGTGLGLFLVRRCAELDGGTVEAASAGEGRGATFAVTWPAAEEVA